MNKSKNVKECVEKNDAKVVLKMHLSQIPCCRLPETLCLHETQQLGKGNRLPGSRLEKIKAAAEQTAKKDVAAKTGAAARGGVRRAR